MSHDPISILIVDDDTSSLLSLERWLRTLDLCIVSAQSGSEALGLLAERDFAVVLLDVYMPKMDGLEVASLMRQSKSTRQIPIIFITGTNLDSYKTIEGYQAGAVDYLTKPLNPHVMCSKVKVFIELHRQKRQLQWEIQKREEAEARLRQAKEAAEAASRSKSQFLANMSHEIRTPLNVIIGLSEALAVPQSQQILNDDFRDKLQKIQTSGKNLARLINNVLDLSKIEANRMELVEEVCDLRNFVKDFYSTQEFYAEQKEVVFTYRISPQVPQEVVLDLGKLLQILTNLVGNAIKFTPPYQQVLLKIFMENKRSLGIRVIDEGIGIPAIRQEEIFEPFEQGDPSTSRQYGGTGLGLAITRRMVELMQGTIHLNSEVGTGSDFTVLLPVRHAPDKSVSTHPSLSKKNQFASDNLVVVVEDNPLNRDVMQAYMNNFGIPVQFASDGKLGVDLVITLLSQQQAPDLVLIDWQMPEMDGLQAIRQIRQHPLGTNLPIVLVSAEAFPEQKAIALNSGANDYLTKPISGKGLERIFLQYLKPTTL